jgi:lycopene cyclase domain-containing protein
MPVYLITYSILFWAPVFLFFLFAFGRLSGPMKKSFLAMAVIMAVFSIGMEWLYLYFDVWSFSEKTDQLLGWRVFGAPVEEFVYWFGATPFCLTVYLGYRRVFGGK